MGASIKPGVIQRSHLLLNNVARGLKALHALNGALGTVLVEAHKDQGALCAMIYMVGAV